ncbi:MAG: hypothetical protein LC797_24445 [Chloroflexi bacterium]|nr:hypothetical protein [Chloroflexota bacterium]
MSECAMAILALMLARYASLERFIHWYRQHIERIDTGELSIPARLVYKDDQLDLPNQPGPDALSIEELHWRTTSVRLELTIWRPYEFSQRRNAERIQQACLEPRSGSWRSGPNPNFGAERMSESMWIHMRTSSRRTQRKRCRGSWGRSVAGLLGLLTHQYGAELRLTEGPGDHSLEWARQRPGWPNTSARSSPRIATPADSR